MIRQLIAALLVLAPVLATAQEQTKGQVLIRALADPALKIAGAAPFEALLFTQDPCDRTQRTLSAPTKLQFEMELEDNANQPLDAAIEALRLIVKRELLVEIVTVPERKAPTPILITWGHGLPAFESVIETISVKYTLFLDNGAPARASVNVSMKSAGGAKTKDKDCP